MRYTISNEINIHWFTFTSQKSSLSKNYLIWIIILFSLVDLLAATNSLSCYLVKYTDLVFTLFER